MPGMRWAKLRGMPSVVEEALGCERPSDRFAASGQVPCRAKPQPPPNGMHWTN